ncbi:hypothetical protein MTYP_00325 [Methylophilaceae bacterium]|nr:hypothetical protein MTYP_00325 [Methylophilaceae bacterium]
MKKFTAPLIAIVLGLSFSVGAMAENMSKTQYNTLEKNIEFEYRNAKAECASLAGNEKDICIVEAKANMRIAKSQLKVDYKPSTVTRYDARVALAEADYSVAMERCDDKSDKNRGACVLDAKAAKASEIANARTQSKASMSQGITNKKISDPDANHIGKEPELDSRNSRLM